jgi:hypothetical protein
MKPSEQISTLANAEEKTQDSILSNIPQPSPWRENPSGRSFPSYELQILEHNPRENLILPSGDEWTMTISTQFPAYSLFVSGGMVSLFHS